MRKAIALFSLGAILFLSACSDSTKNIKQLEEEVDEAHAAATAAQQKADELETKVQELEDRVEQLENDHSN